LFAGAVLGSGERTGYRRRRALLPNCYRIIALSRPRLSTPARAIEEPREVAKFTGLIGSVAAQCLRWARRSL